MKIEEKNNVKLTIFFNRISHLKKKTTTIKLTFIMLFCDYIVYIYFILKQGEKYIYNLFFIVIHITKHEKNILFYRGNFLTNCLFKILF